MENQNINEIYQNAMVEIDESSTSDKLQELKIKFLAKKSVLMSLLSTLGSLPPEERKEMGQKLNEIKAKIAIAIETKENELRKLELEKKLKSETIDISLPSKRVELGGQNPFYVVRDEIIDIFLNMGFEVADGPEVETDLFNFELLNIPQDHPARDMQDTFYISDSVLLRTHTSPVQAHTMKAAEGKPIRIICPGKTYRRDDDDATHSHQFAQIEGLVIDKDINIGHLKATLELFAKKMFGEKREIRLRPSYFPFTEPSVEVDITCANCDGKGCSMCKGTGYIEILGGGMVHPNVLKMNGYDPDKYSGFAFGIGIERVAILRYGIDDIRKFYQNDIRFLRQYRKKA
ncbi:MAG: phenylalanine--tRNA ligase subunit alpha [Bacilli bacterium]|nr:phenylalanine--tRNA ligase subunit alpha [Bacilli bacterium]